MNSLEAMTRLIQLGVETLSLNHSLTEEGEGKELSEYEAQLQTAVAVCQAILNTAIPIARFRMHIALHESMPDFTVSSPSTKAFIEILQLIREKRKNQLITASLWEQYATGAEMLHGFEGNTRADGFKHWIQQVKASEYGSQVQAVHPEGLAVRRSKADEGEDAPGTAQEGTATGS